MNDLSWIKLSLAMFDDDKIQAIEEMPESDTILMLWIRLLILAGKVNDGGLIYLSPNIPYTDELLASKCRRKVKVIRGALDTFEKFGMIERINGGAILLRNWSKYQNIDGLEKIRELNRARQQKFRDRPKNGISLEEGRNSSPPDNVTVTLPSRDVTQQSKKEIVEEEEESENKEQRRGEIPPPPLEVVTPDGVGDEDEVLSYPEQQRILSEIAVKAFKRPVRPADWSNSQKDTWLSEAQPITRGQMAALRWLYGLPPTHRVFTATQRRQSLEKLLEFLCAEIDKAKLVRAEFAATPKKTTLAPEPDGWREAFAALWGVRDDMPERFHQMTGTQQQSVRQKIREMRGETRIA